MSAIDRAAPRAALAGPLAVIALTAAALARGAEAPAVPPPDAPRLTVIGRQVGLERGEWLAWRVEYRLRNDGPGRLIVTPAALAARVEGDVANSRVPGHAVPRPSAPTASGASGLSGSADVIAADEDSRRCRERLTVQAWPESAGPEPTGHVTRAVPPREQPTLALDPGAVVRVRLRLEHRHFVYGRFDPLLGTRAVELRLGPAVVRDRLPLDHPRPPVAAPTSWPPRPPDEFLDRRVFVSPPDSLHLEAHVPGKQSYRFPDCRDVRPGARLRLSFWYLVAPGTAGSCRARVTQCRDLPGSWETLTDGELIIPLTAIGQWSHVERVVRVEPEATSLTLDLGIAGPDVAIGELWVDDLRLDPIDEPDQVEP